MRATRALIHLDNFRRNIRLIRRHTGERPMLCLAVKADAYGHGITGIGTAAEECGVEYLAVATVDEAVELRSAGIRLPILLYSLPTPEELPDVVDHDITAMISDPELADMLDGAARARNRRIAVHLKVDTGMGRIGCTPADAPAVASHIALCGNLHLAGVSTHFAVSDSADTTFTADQIRRFNAAVAGIRGVGIDPGVVHAGNSGGVLAYPDAWYDMVRPGIVAYGYYPSGEQERTLDIRPVMELQSRLVFIKEVDAGTPVSYGATWRAPHRTYIGTVPVGYGDGYFRVLSNRARVSINGVSYPVVGRVCMDQIMVDLGPVCTVARYDPVVLFGPEPGGPDAEELAGLCNTIPYEITCAVSRRVPRVYVDPVP